MTMQLEPGERAWIKIKRADGVLIRYCVIGLDQGRLHISADNLYIKPDGENAVILRDAGERGEL